MSITIRVSEKTEAKIRRRAEKTGQNADKIVSDFVEEAWDEHFPENGASSEGRNPLEPFIGMFSSGETDTSTRYKKILFDDVKMPGGWGGE